MDKRKYEYACLIDRTCKGPSGEACESFLTGVKRSEFELDGIVVYDADRLLHYAGDVQAGGFPTDTQRSRVILYDTQRSRVILYHIQHPWIAPTAARKRPVTYHIGPHVWAEICTGPTSTITTGLGCK